MLAAERIINRRGSFKQDKSELATEQGFLSKLSSELVQTTSSLIDADIAVPRIACAQVTSTSPSSTLSPPSSPIELSDQSFALHFWLSAYSSANNNDLSDNIDNFKLGNVVWQRK